MKPEPKGNGRNRKPKPKRRTAKKLAGDLKSLDELAAEQGITGPQDIDKLIGAGKDLWKSDQEFDEFLAGIYERRRRGR